MCVFVCVCGSSDAGVRQNFHEMRKRRVGELQPLRYEEEAAFEYRVGAWEWMDAGERKRDERWGAV